MGKKKSQDEEPNFEQALEKLESVVGRLEEGEVGLAEALAQYEQGVKHLRKCYSLLQQAEQRIELVSGVNAEGNPIVEAFDEATPDALNEKAARQSRRRSRPSPKLAKQAKDNDGDDEDSNHADDTNATNEMDDPGRLF